MQMPEETLMTVVHIVILALIYMYPSLLAAYENHPKKRDILWINLLTGWTLGGWIVALFLALSAPGKWRQKSANKVLNLPEAGNRGFAKAWLKTALLFRGLASTAHGIAANIRQEVHWQAGSPEQYRLANRRR